MLWNVVEVKNSLNKNTHIKYTWKKYFIHYCEKALGHFHQQKMVLSNFFIFCCSV